MNHKDWDFVNRQLVAKMLAELEYEQVFHAESQGDGRYCINLPGAQWRFSAERGIWGWLYAEQVVGTVAVVTTFLGALLGISTAQYKRDCQSCEDESV